MFFKDLFRKKKKESNNQQQKSLLDTMIQNHTVKCTFTVEQQREWLKIVNKTIPTIMLGGTPLGVDHFLEPHMLDKAGNMLNTVGNVAFTIAKMLSITNMEKALNTDHPVDLIRTYCILDVYAGILTEPYAEQINSAKAYIYTVLEKMDLQKLPEEKKEDHKSENRLFWAPAIYTGDPLVLDEPDYDVHVFPGAAALLGHGVKIPCDNPLPEKYHFAQTASNRTLHLRTLINSHSHTEVVPLFTDPNLLLHIFSPNTRVSVVDYQTACRLCLQDRNRCAGIVINPGRDNTFIANDLLS